MPRTGRTKAAGQEGAERRPGRGSGPGSAGAGREQGRKKEAYGAGRGRVPRGRTQREAAQTAGAGREQGPQHGDGGAAFRPPLFDLCAANRYFSKASVKH